jgi:hypothetical protein
LYLVLLAATSKPTRRHTELTSHRPAGLTVQIGLRGSRLLPFTITVRRHSPASVVSTSKPSHFHPLRKKNIIHHSIHLNPTCNCASVVGLVKREVPGRVFAMDRPNIGPGLASAGPAVPDDSARRAVSSIFHFRHYSRNVCPLYCGPYASP